MNKKQKREQEFKIWREVNSVKLPENKDLKSVFYKYWYMSEEMFVEFLRLEKKYKIGVWKKT